MNQSKLIIVIKSLISGSWEEGSVSSFTSYNPTSEEKPGVHKGVDALLNGKYTTEKVEA